MPALTAVQVIDKALTLQSGETLLVNGAGGATGGLIVAFAVLRGARVPATAGPSSRDRVSRAGARNIVDYHDQEWPERILAATGGRGVDAAAWLKCWRVTTVSVAGAKALKALRVELAAAFAAFCLRAARRSPPGASSR